MVVTHEWKEETETSAAEWKEADRLGVRYSEIIPVLTKAIQEHQALIETQQTLILGPSNKNGCPGGKVIQDIVGNSVGITPDTKRFAF